MRGKLGSEDAADRGGGGGGCRPNAKESRQRRERRILAKQLRRSAASIALNVSEGERRIGGDGPYHFSVAAGSAKETQSNLLCAEAWGYVTSADIAPALSHIDRELGLLWGPTHPR